ncbi:MAG: hypothetical protein LH478_01250 [Chitinophagaceae bacterium]|nr:hypothetical protein [Chitinophagaceae bacterium]
MNQNPSKMSNEDLENDMKAHPHPNKEESTLENANESEEPEVKPLENKTMDMGVDYESDKEQDLDDLVHEQEKLAHNGSTPDPETLKFREGQ